MTAKIGTAISIVGYGLAIWGGLILFRNSVPDTYGTIPVTRPGETGQQLNERINREKGERAANNRFGFKLLTLGSLLQLIGTGMAGFSN